MAVATKLMTVEEFWQRANDFPHCELVRGIIVPKHRGPNGEPTMSPTGRKHGKIEQRIGYLLGLYLANHKIGEAYIGEVGFILKHNPDIMRAPDVAFVSNDRLRDAPEEGYLPFAPDLAVEVMSPNDTVREVQTKVLEYLKAGTRVIWIVEPETETVTVYRSLSEVRTLTKADVLEGGQVLPDLSILVKEIFE
jgi:Uma2 family endonuclease